MPALNMDKGVLSMMTVVRQKLEKTVKNNPKISVGLAIDGIVDDLNIALLGADLAHNASRGYLMQVALETLGLPLMRSSSVRDYLARTPQCNYLLRR